LNKSTSKIILFFVTGFYVGYFPRLPGTAGTLVAIPFSLGINRMASVSLPLALLTLVTAISCAIWLSTRGAVILGQRDPGIIVIDEIVGFMIANFGAPPSVAIVTLAFVLFRFFDIMKPFPMSKLEKLPGGAGIVLDDVMAGLYTFLVLRLILAWGLA